jgi:hypothetical protein
MVLARLNRWSLAELPRMNQAILAGVLPPGALVETLADSVLVDLPAPESFSPRAAQQLVVHLGLAGASVARHYQEEDLDRRRTPERAFERLLVGPDRIPFRGYFVRLADRTGTGHGPRDSLASVVRWNAPAAEVRWAGELLAVLPGAFDDGQIRTYTDDLGEWMFFALVKKTEALELAVNDLLEPLSDGLSDGLPDAPVSGAGGGLPGGLPGGLTGGEAIRRIRIAASLLTAAHKLTADFGSARVGLSPRHFTDVFRQFAGHWEVGDIPPSGALDVESLKRDLLLGLDIPGRDQHILRLFPGLLAPERVTLTRLMTRRPLPDALLASLRLTADGLAEMPADRLRQVVRAQPALAAWYELLAAHARASAAHLALTKKYMFRPARILDMASIPDNGVVSRIRGTTGMVESLLERLVRARLNHVLTSLRQIPQLELMGLAGLPPPPALTSVDVDALVRFVGGPLTTLPASAAS